MTCTTSPSTMYLCHHVHASLYMESSAPAQMAVIVWPASLVAAAGCPSNHSHGPDIMALHAQDFKEVARNPALVGLGAALQYTIMPLMGFLVSRLANLPSAAAVGWASLSSRSSLNDGRACADVQHAGHDAHNVEAMTAHHISDPAVLGTSADDGIMTSLLPGLAGTGTLCEAVHLA